MGFNWATRPSDHRTVSTGKWRHIFLGGDALTFTISAGAATSWKVRNYYQQIVAQGTGLSTSATTLTLNSSNIVGGASTLPFGWYKLYLERSVAAADPWGLSGGDLPFIVVRTSLVLPGRPALGSSTGNDFASDYATMGFARVGPMRHSLYLDGTYATSKANGLADAATEASTWGTADSVRPLRPIACFPEGTGGSSPSGTDTSNIASAVTAFVAAGVSRFEGRNEPNATSTYGTFAAEIVPFAATVRAAGGSVLGPCTIELRGKEHNDWNSGANTGWSWMDGFFQSGGGASIDEVSFHNYNGGSAGSAVWGPGVTPLRGGLPYLRRTMDNFVALLTKWGQQSKPRYNTEAFSQFAAHFGANEPRMQTQNTMLELAIYEQYGIPKERTSIFYPKSHGFWDYPSWLINEGADWTPNPLVATFRTWSEELAGKAFAARLDFGTVENDHYVGSRFTAPDGSGVVAILSDGRYGGQVVLQVTGSSGPLTLVDPWGNISNLTVTGGLASVTVDTLPSYVRLPAGVTAVPVAAGYGIDTVTPRSVYVTKAVATPSTFPGATSTVTFPNVTRIDTVEITTGPVLQSVCGLLDFDVQTFSGGTWTTQSTVTVATDTIPWTSHQDAGGGLTDSAYSRQNVFVVKFPDDVACTAVRVYARDVTYGGEPTAAASNGNGFSNLYSLSFSAAPTGGTFTLTWNGMTTGTIAYNAAAATIQTALRALTGGSATVVTGGPPNTAAVYIDFKTAPSWRSLTGNGAGLTGGTINVNIGNVPNGTAPNTLAYDGNTQGAGQAGPKVLACEIRPYLSGKTDGGGTVGGQPFLILGG